MLKINGKHINVHARKDKGPSEMKPENMRLAGRIENGIVKLHIHDDANPEFYLDVEVSSELLSEGIVNEKPT